MRYHATLNVNGIGYPVEVEPSRSLLSVLRTEVGLTGSKEGCDDSECGACMVLLDGRPVNSCSYLALQADGREVTTIEGLASASGELHPLQRAFPPWFPAKLIALTPTSARRTTTTRGLWAGWQAISVPGLNRLNAVGRRPRLWTSSAFRRLSSARHTAMATEVAQLSTSS